MLVIYFFNLFVVSMNVVVYFINRNYDLHGGMHTGVHAHSH